MLASVKAASPNILDRLSRRRRSTRVDRDLPHLDGRWLALCGGNTRRALGWWISRTMSALLVPDALIMAIWCQASPTAFAAPSDRTSQYNCEQVWRLAAGHCITCLIGRSGNVRDNAARDGFLSSLKSGRPARKVYRARNDARADVRLHQVRLNPKRRRSTIGYAPMVTQPRVHQTGSSSSRAD